MCSSDRTCGFLREYLATMDTSAPPGKKARKLLQSRLKSYLFWKGKLSDQPKAAINISTSSIVPEDTVSNDVSEALKRKDALRKERQGSRRRLRGAPPGSNIPGSSVLERAREPNMRSGAMGGETVIKEEADELAKL